jgi:citrate lyase subunit beta / citryl-CoA lyase
MWSEDGWPYGTAVLFCPANRPELSRKALDRADVIVLDLEDAVDPGEKESARDALRAQRDELPWHKIMVRVNAWGTPWFADDAALMATLPGVTTVVPMVESRTALSEIPQHDVVPLIETARGVLALTEVLAAENCRAVMWGSEDLAQSLGGRASRHDGLLNPAMQAARSAVLIEAAVRGIPAIDAVAPGFDDRSLAALHREAHDAAQMGFSAKACIHPVQIGPIREAFRATVREVEDAREVLAAAESRSGAFAIRGSMVDEPLIARARRIVAESESR